LVIHFADTFTSQNFQSASKSVISTGKGCNNKMSSGDWLCRWRIKPATFGICLHRIGL